MTAEEGAAGRLFGDRSHDAGRHAPHGPASRRSAVCPRLLDQRRSWSHRPLTERGRDARARRAPANHPSEAMSGPPAQMVAQKKAHPSRPTQYPGAPLVEIEAMLLRLTELRQHEASKDRRADYGAVIDRLHALAYRLTEAPGRTIGLPKPRAAPAPIAPAPSAAAKPPQAALPLGPVIVRARKPRPR